MNHNIWMINQYASTPNTGYGGRTYYLARGLASLGHRVTLVSGSHTHLMRTIPPCTGRFTVTECDGFRHVRVRTLPYDEARSPRRVFNWFSFSHAIPKCPMAVQETPDLVLYSSPSVIGFLGAKKLAAMHDAPLVFDVRDIWPKTLVELGGIRDSHPLIRSMRYVEKMAYRDSDLVMSNLRYAVDHMRASGMDSRKFRWVPNGIWLPEVEAPDPFPKAMMDRWPKHPFIVGYTGTLGQSNCLDVLVSAAKRLLHRKDVAIVLVGNGAKKAELVKRAKEENITNLHFFDAVNKTCVQSVLSRCDACYFGVSDSKLYEYGIGAIKLPEYMYSGRPVIMSYSGKGNPVGPAGCGVVVPAQDERALASAIVELSETPKALREEMGQKGRRAAIQQYGYHKLAKRLSEEFGELLTRPGHTPVVQERQVG